MPPSQLIFIIRRRRRCDCSSNWQQSIDDIFALPIVRIFCPTDDNAGLDEITHIRAHAVINFPIRCARRPIIQKVVCDERELRKNPLWIVGDYHFEIRVE